LRVAFYARVSSDEQAERGTIESQVEFAKKYFDLHGPSEGIEGYEIYLDDGVSGTIPLEERPGASKMMTDAKRGKFRAVYVYRLDRLARSTLHVLSAYDFFEKHNIALKSMTEAFDTSTSTGKFFMTMLASIAALERDTILERTQMGKERAARQGKWTSGPPPFGYRIGLDGQLVVYEPEAEIVRLIFRLYLEGMKTVPIAEYLNSRNIPTPTCSKKTKNKSVGLWHAGHISIILRTTAYIGEYQTMKRSKRKKTGVTIFVPPIISKEDFIKANELLIKNADAARGSRGRQYLLRGLIFCGSCGRAMVGSSGNSKSGRVYYRCTGTVNNGQGKFCNAKQIRAVDIENAVWKDIKEFIKNPGNVVEAIERRLQQEKSDLTPIKKELEEVEKFILEKKAARAKIISMVSRGLITDEEAEKELNLLAGDTIALEMRKDKLFNQINENQKIQNEAITAAMLLENLKDKVDALDESLKTELIRGLVKKVEIYPEEKDGKRVSRAVIHYRFGDPKEMYDSKDSSRYLEPYIISSWVFPQFCRSGGTREYLQ